MHSHLRPAVKMLGKIALEDLTRSDLRRYEASFVSDGRKQSTIHLRVKLAKNVAGWARSTGLIEKHQLDGHTVKRGERNQDPPPTPDEVQRIVEAAPSYLRRGVLLGYFLGMRFGPSEVLSVTWDDFNALDSTLTVRCAKNKQRPWRKVCLAPAMMHEMLAWQQEDAGLDVECIVHRDGKKVRRLYRAWLAACKQSGITRHLKAYDLRHTFATQALAGGADLKAVASSMGHQDATQLLTVYQSNLDHQRRAVATSIPNILGVQGGVQEPPQIRLDETSQKQDYQQ